MLAFLILVVSLAALLLAADLLIRGAVAVASSMRISPLLIGLTIVAFGTSAPELVISVQAAWAGVPGIALGNIVGSNIANILLVLGVPAVFAPIATSQVGLKRNLTIMLVATAIFMAMCFTGSLDFIDGAILFALIIAFIAYSGIAAANRRKADPVIAELTDVESVGHVPQKRLTMIGYIIAGLAGLPLASHFLVESAADIAVLLGVDESIIGLSLIAVGTSLPELAATVSAAIHRQPGLAIGNVVGSNVFNLLAVGGAAGMAAQIPVPDSFLQFDLWVMVATSLLLVPFAVTRKSIGRITGIAFLIAYIVFIVLKFAA